MPKYHSPEYLDQAIRLIVEVGHPVDFVSSRLNISSEVLTAAVSQYESRRAQPASNRDNEMTQGFSVKAGLFNIARRRSL
jgi:hypothetical protein